MNSAFILVCRKQPCEGEGLTSRYSTQTQKMKEMREEGREEWVVGSGVAKGGQKGPSSLSSLQWRRNQSLVSQTVLFLLSSQVLCSLTVFFFSVSSPSTKPPTCGHLTNMLFRRPSSFYHARAVSVVLCVARICFPYIVNHLCSLGRAFSSGTGGAAAARTHDSPLNWGHRVA